MRGVLYSSGQPQVSAWMYDEEKARRFMLQYAGGGTDFPFPMLQQFCDEDGAADVVRVIISDEGFLWDLEAASIQTLHHAVKRSAGVIALLVTWTRTHVGSTRHTVFCIPEQ